MKILVEYPSPPVQKPVPMVSPSGSFAVQIAPAICGKGREQISLRNKIKKGVKFLPLAKGEVRRG
jgi:hypothetical protein